MVTRLRKIISGRFSLVGPQLQSLWQETLTTGYVLKQALSVTPSPRSSDAPINTPEHEPAQQDPLLDPQNLSIIHAATQGELSKQADKATQTEVDASASEPTTHAERMTTMMSTTRREPRQASPNSRSCSSTQSDDTSPSNANTTTQTEEPSPRTDHTSEFTASCPDEGLGMDFDNHKGPLFGHDQDHDSSSQPASQTDVEPCKDSWPPEVLDGPSQVIVANHDSQNCLAILVTKEMIEYMENIAKDSEKLERLEAKFADVDERVKCTRINVEYCEKLLEMAESREEIAELRDDINRHQSTLPEDEKCLKALQRRIGLAKSNLTYSKDLSRSILQQTLNNAGLLQSSSEHDEDEDTEDDNASQASESQADYEAESRYSDASDISMEELAKRAAKEEVQAKHEAFLEAERDFDNRYDEYTHKKRLLRERHLEEPDHSNAQEVLDLCYIEREQELTRNLTAAEDAYEEAWGRARYFGPNEWDQESYFADDEYDGYPLSWENDVIASTPVDYIYGWLEDIPDVENLPDVAKLDLGADQEFGQENLDDIEVCDIQSLQLSDAWSLRDWSRNRKRIDRWRAMTGMDR
ncbi:MAG: hypothetical protein LQ337_003861 [Flavoplaca oasis]|nr:MAG: hypothetical protein LQ337_003861 [Flavoplaca oasis]